MFRLFIKNMVCQRCVMAVEQELLALKLIPQHVTLGEIVLKEELSEEQRKQFEKRLRSLGFELIDDRKSQLIERIKILIREVIHHQQEPLKVNISEFLAHQLHYDYSYLSGMFSEIEGTTIEKYVIAQKIEKVKELLVYDELSLSEIAYRLNYSSVAYLSHQFKHVTGLSPSHFKQIRHRKRKPLDRV